MSSNFTPCSTCETERETATLNPAGQCPFCVDAGVPAPEAPTPQAPVSKYPEIVIRPPGTEPFAAARAAKAATKAAIAAAAADPAPKVPKASSPERQIAVDEAFELPYTPPSFDQAQAEADPAKELAMRALCRRRFLPFVQRYRPKYMAGWVHEDICRRLERFIRDVEQGKSPRLLLMMPPRSGKSELGSRHFPPWVLGQHPDWEIIAASHTSSLTLSFSRYIRDLTRDPSFQALFPDMRLDPTSQSVENWNTLSGGGYMAAGVGTGITGRGAHILLLDDLVKDIEAADSPTIRENTWEWYGSTAYTRLAPGGGVLGIMTWWNEDDWAGKIQQVMASGEGDTFEVIKYPAINDEGDEYLLPSIAVVVVGGALITLVGWRAIFLVNLPIGLAGLWLAWRFAGETARHQQHRLDLPGQLAAIAALGTLAGALLVALAGGALHRIEALAERLKALRESAHPQAQFVWALLRNAFHYAAVTLESIAESAREVDFAMRWGFGMKQGPFEIWQEAG